MHVVPSDPKSNPLVCSFPNGLPESLQASSNGDTSSPDSSDLPQFEWHRGSRLMGHDGACHYTSVNTNIRRHNSTRNEADVSAPKRQTTQLAVGIYDKQTGRVKLQLVAENGSVFCLQQHVTSYVSSVTTHTTVSSSANAAMEYRQLYQDFGSAKKKRVLQSQEANRVTVQDDDNEETSVWNATPMSESNRVALAERRAVLAATDDSTAALLLASQNDAAVDAATMTWRRTILLPPFWLEATTPRDVYQAVDLCGKAVWEWSRRLVEQAWTTDDTNVGATVWRTSHAGTNVAPTSQWTESVRDLLDRIPYTTSKRATLSADRIGAVQHQLSCAVVLHHFVVLYKEWHSQRFIPQFMAEQDVDDETKEEKHRRPAALLSTPLLIRQRFLSAFATVTSQRGRTGYAMSKVNVDCCLVHLLLLYLVAHSTGEGGSATNGKRKQRPSSSSSSSSSSSETPLSADHVERLVDDLRVEPIKAMQLARQAGCIVARSTATSKQFGLSLSTPLTFPPPRRKKAAPSR